MGCLVFSSTSPRCFVRLRVAFLTQLGDRGQSSLSGYRFALRSPSFGGCHLLRVTVVVLKCAVHVSDIQVELGSHLLGGFSRTFDKPPDRAYRHASPLDMRFVVEFAHGPDGRPFYIQIWGHSI